MWKFRLFGDIKSQTQFENCRLYIHAYNVHRGGGLSLLEALLKALSGDIVLTADNRMLLPSAMATNIQVKRVAPSILQRLLAEKWLAQVVSKNDVIFCFGNLPPLFRLQGRTVVFVQNRYLIENVSLSGFPIKDRIRLTIERLWLAKRLMNVDEFVVQTYTMKRFLDVKAGNMVPVRVLPFVAAPNGYKRSFNSLNDRINTDFDFVYVASGEPHKNHRKLIDAWCLLAQEGLFPTLCVTLHDERFSSLCLLIESFRQRYGLKVTNVGELTHCDVALLYKKSLALIYPSIFESFGLPLIEARQAGLPILASELDYVRDVVDPEQTFDPDSSVSIARSIKRFLGLEEKQPPLQDPSGFINDILKRSD